jgi:hypothetical protein
MISGSSKTMTVAGQYEPIALDSVARVSVEEGEFVLHGTSASVRLAPPAEADPAKVTRNWALVTEAPHDASRSMTFIHAESLDEFSIDLPASGAPLKYGAFLTPAGAEVMVLAWGENAASYWGWVTIGKKTE